MSSPSAQVANSAPKKLPASQTKYIEFMYHVVGRLDFLGDVVKQQMLDSIVFAPVEFQHELISSFLENQKSKVIAKEIADKKKQIIVDKKNADKQSKLDEKKRIKEENDLAKKEERQRVKEEKRAIKLQEKEDNDKKKKDLKIKNSKKNPIVVSENIISTTNVDTPDIATSTSPPNTELAAEEFVHTPNKDEAKPDNSPSLVKKAIKKRVTKKKKEEDA